MQECATAARNFKISLKGKGKRMRKKSGIFIMAVIFSALIAGTASATPSTQIWIPSTDIQAFKTIHIGFDDYIRTQKNPDGTYAPIVFDTGITAGVLPFEKVQAEIGIDYIRYGTTYDDNPIYFNAKVGVPEDAFFKYQPAVAVGIYNVGTRGGNIIHNTQQDIGYGLVAKTIPVIGRLSVGGYWANANNVNFKDHHGNTDNAGVLASWDRTLTEISDKLWAAVDYQSGNNAYGALNFGVSYAFSKNVSVIVGYDIYARKATGGQPTFTTQVDINFP
jgi:hypothetical protein